MLLGVLYECQDWVYVPIRLVSCVSVPSERVLTFMDSIVQTQIHLSSHLIIQLKAIERHTQFQSRTYMS